MDDPMNGDSPIGGLNASAAEEAILRTVRTLEQTGPGEDGEHITRIWRLLVPLVGPQLHAAEKSVLRWLLREMNSSFSSSKHAEAIRRFPVTWNILGCIFKRVPLFSLAKALADRRFVAVLRQTLKDISKPSQATTPASPGKRKRPALSFDSEDMKDGHGCLASAEAVFAAIMKLLSRLDSIEQGSDNDRLGAEHIKSLFCCPAMEAIDTISPLLSLCKLALITWTVDDTTDWTDWIEVASKIWDLHLRDSSDALEVASYLYREASLIIGKIERIPEEASLPLKSKVVNAWSSQLQTLLHRNLILPAKTAFLNRGDLEILERAMDTSKGYALVASPVMYWLICRAPDVIGGKGSRADNQSWMQEVFRIVERPIYHRVKQNDRRNLQTESLVVASIIQEAVESAGPRSIATQDLRNACRTYALGEDSTDWKFLYWAAQCDEDTFMVSHKDFNLLDETLDRIVSGHAGSDEDCRRIYEFVSSLCRGFETARDLAAFFKIWFQELSKCVERGLEKEIPRAVWFSRDFFEHSPQQGAVQRSMTTKQLLSVLDWMDVQESAFPDAIFLVLETVTRELTQEDFQETVGPMICRMVLKRLGTDGRAPDLVALRWRILGRAVSWTSLEERDRVWLALRERLQNTIETIDLRCDEGYEVLNFLYQLLVSMYPDGEAEPEVASAFLAAITRLARELSTLGAHQFNDKWIPLGALRYANRQKEHESRDSWPARYLDWILYDANRLIQLVSRNTETLEALLKSIFSLVTRLSSPSNLTIHYGNVDGFFDALFSNEDVANNAVATGMLIDFAIELLKAGNSRDQAQPCAVIEVLSRVPDECLTRRQRENVMEILIRQREDIDRKTGFVSHSTWRKILGLMIRIMRRPTFYEDMKFDDLVVLADALARSFMANEQEPESLRYTEGLADQFYVLATSTIRQIIQGFDARGAKYFKQVGAFVAKSDNSKVVAEKFLRMSLLQAVISVASESSNFRTKSAAFDLEVAKDHLAEIIRRVLRDYSQTAASWERGRPDPELYPVLIAVKAAVAVEDRLTSPELALPIAELEEASNSAISQGLLRGWMVRDFLVKYFPRDLHTPTITDFGRLCAVSYSEFEPRSEVPPDAVFKSRHDDVVISSVEATIKGLDGPGRLRYIKDLIANSILMPRTEGIDGTSGMASPIIFEAQLLAVYHAIELLKGTSGGVRQDSDFDLAVAHTQVLKLLPTAETRDQYVSVARVICLLLDTEVTEMTQWNIEATLSAVCLLCGSDQKGSRAKTSKKWYEWICKLVEVILRKHRLRIEGHYHILVTTMQSILRHLLQEHGHGPDQDQKWYQNNWEAHAKLYTRLITLICEPSVAAVTRSQQTNVLKSATDSAKRSAGKHMYLILMLYVKLLLEVDVPHEVRNALEPGMNSIFDITSPEVRRVMNDGLDESGRAILRELFARYTKFGKWSGL